MSSTKTCIGVALLAFLALAIRYSPGQATKPAAPPSDDIVYQPSPHSIGHVRVEAASTEQNREGGDDHPSLYILAPDHVGLTIQEQPVVFWYLSKPTDVPLVLTLMPQDPKAKDPLLDINLDGTKAGIQSIDLAKYPVKLEPNAVYQLSLALKPDHNKGSKDVYCTTEITRTIPPHPLVAQMLDTADPWEKAKLLARNGVFLDALTMLSREIAADEKNEVWHERRANLLQQVGLTEVASFDRSASAEAHTALDP